MLTKLVIDLLDLLLVVDLDKYWSRRFDLKIHKQHPSNSLVLMAVATDPSSAVESATEPCCF